MSGRPFLQIPGPTNVPDRILRAMDRAAIDPRGPELGAIVRALLPDVARIFTSQRGTVVLYPASGTGAGEVARAEVGVPIELAAGRPFFRSVRLGRLPLARAQAMMSAKPIVAPRSGVGGEGISAWGAGHPAGAAW